MVRPGSAPDLLSLSRETDDVWRLAHEADFSEIVPLLVDLLPRLEAACRSVDVDKERSAAFSSLARAYHATAAVLAKLGETDAAWVAADHSIGAAERAGDPLLMAAGTFRLALVFEAERRHEQVEHTVQTAVEAIGPLVAAGTPAALSVAGALRLQLAIVAARTNDADRAHREIEAARALGERLGQDGNDYHTEFGPTNVRLHEIAVAVDLGDAGTALRLAAGVDASGMSPERQARLLIDVGRAHLQRRNLPGALRALLDAERLTPEQVHAHRLVKNIMYDLARSEHRTDPRVRGLAQRCGVRVRRRLETLGVRFRIGF